MNEPTPVDRALLARLALPRPGEDADKEERGRVLIVGGSNEVPGAVLLAGLAALRVGAGKLRLATTRTAATPLALAVPEARVFSLPESGDGCIADVAAPRLGEIAASVDAVVLGPGITEPGAVAALVAAVAEQPRPQVVLDAAALYCLMDVRSVIGNLRGRLVLTPNESEMDAMGADDALALARELGAVVSRKGPTTFTATPEGDVYADDSGTPGLGTSGSGDVVAGAAGGLLARGASPAVAAVWANHLHGRAGERLARRIGAVGFIAREVVDELPAILADLERA